MGSKLRPLYDRLYIGGETLLLALEGWRDGRRDAKKLPAREGAADYYKNTVRPYWRQFRVRTPGAFWFRLYCNGHRPDSPQYIPDYLWYRRIVPHYNNLIFAKALQDKCMHGVLFPDMRRPVTVVKRMAGVFYTDDFRLLSFEEAVERFSGHGRVIIKPSVGSGQGHGIRFFDSDAMTADEIAALFRQYGRDFIVQEKMEQHPDLARLNPGSLNTVRLITFLHDGQVDLLAAILRVGGSSSEVDNTSQGGFKATVLPDGRLADQGMNNHYRYADAYENGIPFSSVTVPCYDRIVAAVKDHAAKMAHFRLIGWDIAVAPDGEPVLVEYNVIPAQAHATNGPLFGELTDQVLAEVFGRRG